MVGDFTTTVDRASIVKLRELNPGLSVRAIYPNRWTTEDYRESVSRGLAANFTKLNQTLIGKRLKSIPAVIRWERYILPVRLRIPV